MATLHRFGGNWTEEKLRRLRDYLRAYMTIFHGNERAQFFTTHYVDAFAGTGSRVASGAAQPTTLALFSDQDLVDVRTFYSGSARIALETEPPFDRFLFIEQNAEYVRELEGLKVEFPDRADSIDIREGDANALLQRWCRSMSWHRNRAVVFLDPYGMSVAWETFEAIANTKAVDLWVLLPVGQAINRLLTREGPPTGPWADRLTTIFGTDSWRDAFYKPIERATLFPLDDEFEKQADFESISGFFVQRLKTIFPPSRVVDDYLVLLNSKNNPIFVLFFAAANPDRAAEPAIRIARDILRR